MTPNENTQAEREVLSDAESRMLTFLFSNMEGLSDKDWFDHGFRLSTFNGLERKTRAALSAPPAYADSTPGLHIGDSAFEDWYQRYLPNSVGHKQIARDAYAAGMGDPLVTAATPVAAVAQPASNAMDEGCIRKALGHALRECDTTNAQRLAIFNAFMPRWTALAASPSCEQSAAHAEAETLDVCTDADNCTRCKTARKFRGDTEHAGIPVGNSFGAKGAAS